MFFFSLYGDHRDLHVLTHSFPTRRSSDLAWPCPRCCRCTWCRRSMRCWRRTRVPPKHWPSASTNWQRGPRMSIIMRPPDSKPGHRKPHRPARDTARQPQSPLPAPELRNSEDRYYGLNACLAVFAQRPQELRKVWLLESRIPALKPVLAFCVANKLGYRVVEDADLARLTGSQHHEGVCFAEIGRAHD